METVGDDGLYRQSYMETTLCSAKLKVLQWFRYSESLGGSLGGGDNLVWWGWIDLLFSFLFFSFRLFFSQKKQSYSCGIFVYRLT
jgi:hypothetical protein